MTPTEKVWNAIEDLILKAVAAPAVDHYGAYTDAILAIVREHWHELAPWRPIEEAPRDGTPVIGWRESEKNGSADIGTYFVTWPRKDSWVLLDHSSAGGGRYHWEPTHYAPLPAPPEGEE